MKDQYGSKLVILLECLLVGLPANARRLIVLGFVLIVLLCGDFGQPESAQWVNRVTAQAATADARFAEWMRAAQRLARRGGFTAAFPDFSCETVRQGDWDRRRCGLVLLNSLAAEERWLSDADLGVSVNPRPGDVFTLASDYAARIGGFVGAFPTMRTRHDPSLGRFWQVVLIRPGAAEWRDVEKRELGPAAEDDWDVRIRHANVWARSRGFVGASQNFHAAVHDVGQGLVYGTYLFSGIGSLREMVPGIVFGLPDTPVVRPVPAEMGAEQVVLSHQNGDPWATFSGGFTGLSECGTTQITEAMNTSAYALRLRFTDCAGRTAEETVSAYSTTRAFNNLDLNGKWRATLAESVFFQDIHRIPIGVSVSWASTATMPETGPRGEPTPYPQTPNQPSAIGWYRIILLGNQASLTNPKPAQAVTVDQSGCMPGMSLTLRSPAPVAQQLFRFIPYQDGTFAIKSTVLNFDWDVEGGTSVPGARLQLYPELNVPNQRFRLEPHFGGNEFAFRIRPQPATSQLVTPANFSLEADAQIVLAPQDGEKQHAQTFRLELAFPGGWVRRAMATSNAL